ncbi:hypothetical protein GCM10009637_05620 [Brevibacterium luteolum]
MRVGAAEVVGEADVDELGVGSRGRQLRRVESLTNEPLSQSLVQMSPESDHSVGRRAGENVLNGMCVHCSPRL